MYLPFGEMTITLETNSFHLPFDEMTITLEDVFYLTGLQVTGKSVQLVGEDVVGAQHTVCRLLGVSAHEVHVALSERGGYVKLKWLHNKFGCSTCNDNDSTLYKARAYLLYTLGCTLFADKTGGQVPANYLRLFEEAGKFGEYAWGAATLTFLYRQLGLTSRVGVKQISGYLTLLEAWIYEHFPTIARVPSNVAYQPGQPFAMRSAPQGNIARSEHMAKAYRAQLDSLKAEDVVWDLYVRFRNDGERPEIMFYEGCMSACDVVEPYLPERVLRQFGFVQRIPHAPLDPKSAKRGKKSGQYRVIWRMVSSYFEE